MTDTTATPAETQDTSTTTTESTTTSQPAATTTPAPTAAATTTTEATTQPATTAPADAPKEPASAWGEKWREEYAGEDAALLKRLQRYTSPKAAIDALIVAQKKISDGSYKKPLDAKATPEEVAEYRKALGIPDQPAGYLEKLPNGLVIGDDDKPIIEGFAAALHAKHASPEIVHTAIEWYNKFQDEMEGKMHETNVQAKAATEDELRQEWGADYRQNTNLINAFIGTMPEDVREELFQSTTPDGKQVMNNPKMMQWLAQQARELNYTGATLPNGQQTAKSLDGEINELVGMMGNRSSKYWKGPEAEKLQARYRELITIKEKLAARAA